MSNEPKGQHFLPVTLQKRFTDADGWLHAFRFADPQNGVFKCRPEGLFKKRELYTFKDAEGRAERGIERKLSRIESNAEPVLARLVEAARAGSVPTLTVDEEATWIRFYYLQWKRVPDLHRTVTTPEYAGEMFDEILEEARQKFPNRVDEIDRYARPEEKARMIQKARVESLPMMSEEVFGAMFSRGIGIARIARPDKRFVLGSRPVVRFSNKDLRDPGCELWLPIAGDVMVGVGRGRRTEFLMDATPSQVRHVNCAITSQSTMIASGSAALTRSLASAR